MRQYTDLLRDVLANGTDDSNRTKTPARRVFGRQIRFDLARGFPLLGLKFVPMKLVASELLWFIRGDTNLAYLHEHNNHIWDEWATETGDLGPVYGRQWRAWPLGPHAFDDTIDQLEKVIQDIKDRPNSRRLIVSAWNVAELPDETISPQANAERGQMALAPCHTLFQFAVIGDKLHLQLYQRSADLFLGVPFNIASYALLQHMVANLCNLYVGDFVHTFGDAHIYLNHMDQVEELLARETNMLPNNPALLLPVLEVNPNVRTIDQYQLSDFNLRGYNPLPAIKAPVAI